MWGAIKKAINSTLGTSDFQPLDEMITEGKTIVASDEPLFDIAGKLNNGSSAEEQINLKKIKFKTSGSLKAYANLLGNNAKVYVYVNDTLKTTLAHLGSSSGEETATVYFSKNDVLKITYSLYGNNSIYGVGLRGTVKDISPLRIIEG